MAVIPLSEKMRARACLRHGHVHFGVTFMLPSTPLSACCSASLKRLPEGKILNSAAMSTTIKGLR